MQFSMQGGRVLEMCEPVAKCRLDILGCVTCFCVESLAGGGRGRWGQEGVQAVRHSSSTFGCGQNFHPGMPMSFLLPLVNRTTSGMW